jgi:hypothetical protein
LRTAKKLPIPCLVNVNGKWSNSYIHDLSDAGLLVSGLHPPAIGTYVDIRRGALVIIGRVIWADGPRFRVRTQDAVSIADLFDEPLLKRRPAVSGWQAPPKSVLSAIEQAERNRRRSSAFQFVCLTIFALGMAYFAAISCYRTLAVPFDAAADVLSGPMN